MGQAFYKNIKILPIGENIINLHSWRLIQASPQKWNYCKVVNIFPYFLKTL